MKEITPNELKMMRDAHVDHQLVDIREAYEAEICSMGGQLIPMGEVIERLEEIRRDVPVVIHCRSGNRAAAMIEALTTRYGFSNVHNLKGGIQAFAEEVDPTITCD